MDQRLAGLRMAPFAAGRIRRMHRWSTASLSFGDAIPRSIDDDESYSCSKPWTVNFSVPLFSLTVRTT